MSFWKQVTEHSGKKICGLDWKVDTGQFHCYPEEAHDAASGSSTGRLEQSRLSQCGLQAFSTVVFLHSPRASGPSGLCPLGNSPFQSAQKQSRRESQSADSQATRLRLLILTVLGVCLLSPLSSRYSWRQWEGCAPPVWASPEDCDVGLACPSHCPAGETQGGPLLRKWDPGGDEA